MSISLPDWMRFNPETRVISGTPKDRGEKIYLNVTVEDSVGKMNY